jgi:DNA polymerase-3 subunit alpha
LREKRANTICLKIATKKLDQILISDLSKLFIENKGNCAVKFIVFDPLDDIEVELPSKNVRVDPNNEFVNKLKEFDLEFKLM